MDQYYVDSSYWDEGYAGYLAEAQIDAGLYIEENYFDPNDYYEVRSSFSTLSCDAEIVTGEVVEANGSWSSEFTQTSTPSRILQASATFTDAFTPLLTIDVIKNSFAVLDVVASINTNAVANKNGSIDLVSSFTSTANVVRIRDLNEEYSYTWEDLQTWDEWIGGDIWTVTGPLLLSKFTSVIDTDGEIVECSGNWTSEFTQTTQIQKILNASSNQTSTFEQQVIINKINSGESSQTAEFTQTVTASRIIEFASEVTSAFSPVMTVSAIRNSFAVLDATTSISIDAQANRAANITLESIVNQSLTGVRIRGYASNQTSTFSQTSDAVKTAQASSTQSSAFSITANVGKTQISNAELTSKFSFFPSKYIGTGRPRNLAGGSFTTSSKFGTHALRGDTTYSTPVYASSRPKVNQDWAVEAWQYADYKTSGLNSTTINFSWIQFGTTGTDGMQPSLIVRNSSGNFISFIGSSIINLNAWNHLLIVKNSSRLSFYVNGNRVYTTTTLPDSYDSSNVNSFRAAAFPSRGDNRLDEVSIWHNTSLGYNPDNTTITVSSSARTNNENTIALWHMDNNIFDDISAIQINGSANLLSSANLTSTTTIAYDISLALSSASNISTLGEVNKQAASELSSEFTQSNIIDRIRSADSTQFAEFAQTVEGAVTRTTSSDISSQSTQTADATRIQQAEAQFDAVATQLTAVAKVGDFLIACDVVATQNTVAVKTTDVVSTQSSEFSQSVDGIKAVEVSATLVAEVSTNISTRKVAGLTSLQSSQFAQSADVNYTAESISSQTATAQLSVDAAGSTVGFSAELNSNFSQNTDISRIRFGLSTQSSEFAQTVINIRSRQFDSQVASQFDQTASALRIFDSGTVEFDSIATQLSAVVKTGNALIASDVISTLNADINVTAAGVTALDAEFAQNTNAAKNAVSSAQVNSTFTQVSAGIKAVNAVANLTSEFALTADVVKATDAIVIKVGEFTQTASAVKTASAVSNFESIAFKMSAGDRIRDVEADLVGTSTVIATPNKFVNFSANIDSAMQFTVGFKVIHIDPYLTWKIQRDDRSYNIREESRLHKIKG